MATFLTHWLTITLALGVTSWILPGVQVRSLAALAVAALVLGWAMLGAFLVGLVSWFVGVFTRPRTSSTTRVYVRRW